MAIVCKQNSTNMSGKKKTNNKKDKYKNLNKCIKCIKKPKIWCIDIIK